MVNAKYIEHNEKCWFRNLNMFITKKTIQFYRGDPNLGFLKQFSHADMVRWNPVKNALIQNFRCEMELFAELLFLRETGNIIIAKYSSI